VPRAYRGASGCTRRCGTADGDLPAAVVADRRGARDPDRGGSLTAIPARIGTRRRWPRSFSPSSPDPESARRAGLLAPLLADEVCHGPARARAGRDGDAPMLPADRLLGLRTGGAGRWRSTGRTCAAARAAPVPAVDHAAAGRRAATAPHRLVVVVEQRVVGGQLLARLDPRIAPGRYSRRSRRSARTNG